MRIFLVKELGKLASQFLSYRILLENFPPEKFKKIFFSNFPTEKKIETLAVNSLFSERKIYSYFLDFLEAFRIFFCPTWMKTYKKCWKSREKHFLFLHKKLFSIASKNVKVLYYFLLGGVRNILAYFTFLAARKIILVFKKKIFDDQKMFWN